MGAVTVTIRKRVPASYYIICDITGSASYATNGDTYVLSQFGSILAIDAIVDAGTPGYVLVPDLANKKIKYFKGAAGLLVEETNATNLSAVVSRCIVYIDDPNI